MSVTASAKKEIVVSVPFTKELNRIVVDVAKEFGFSRSEMIRHAVVEYLIATGYLGRVDKEIEKNGQAND